MSLQRLVGPGLGVAAGILAGVLLSHGAGGARGHSTGAVGTAETRPNADADLAALRAEVQQLKEVIADQAHAMADVGYHFSNLWFAARAENWPLAEFYLGETRSHLRWAVRMKPVRKDNAGQEIKLAEILEAVENGPLAQLLAAVQAKDQKGLQAAYRFTLESCYACHKASDKPYLRPQVPASAATQVINADPQATWPK